MGTVRSSHIERMIKLYEYLDSQKDPNDNRTRLFSHEIAVAIGIPVNKVSQALQELMGLGCINLIKRSSGGYYPSIYELVTPPTRSMYLKFRERSDEPGGVRITISPSERNRLEISDLRGRVQRLEEIIKSMSFRLTELESE